ncbi:MAG: cytochrome c biogenesis protein CcsA [Methylococcaceae bacterium]|jgi:ABC-type uncharacterized transport system permease subunit|nr:cytochrome c biogenesis protein CcsA [Methylococcaceae bacterium]
MQSMVSTVFGSLAILGYLTALSLMLWSLRRALVSGAEWVQPGRLGHLLLGGLAIVLHGAAIVGPDTPATGTNFSFLNALSLVTLSVNAILLLAALLRPVDKLWIITFPLAAAILLLKILLPEETRVVQDHSWQMTVHIFSSLLAYSFLNIAAIQAVLLAVQDRCLRSRHPDGYLVRSLPSLQSMETLMFQLIGAGLLLLTVSLVTGFVFLENMFAQHLAHKTVLSLLAWLVFAILLLGRLRYGWRGQIAIRWTLGGFVALMLAYFGSKMVLELILNRV